MNASRRPCHAAPLATAFLLNGILVERLGWRAHGRPCAVLLILGAPICGTSASLAPFLPGRAVMACGGCGRSAIGLLENAPLSNASSGLRAGFFMCRQPKRQAVDLTMQFAIGCFGAGRAGSIDATSC